MRLYSYASAVLSVAAAALFCGPAAAKAMVGEPAPSFDLPASTGDTLGPADYAGKYVVLEWTNDGCPFVQKHYNSHNMQDLQQTYTDQGVIWLSVVSSAPGKQGYVTAEQAQALTESRDAAPTAVLLDPSGEVGHAYGAKTTPHMYIIDPKGTLIYAGGIDSIPSADPDDIARATPYVKIALDEALAGKPVSEPVTRPYGCSVKYQ